MPNQSRSTPLRMKEGSPFTPGNPVPVELFVGRETQIEEILRYARQACAGRLENIFLTGDRGIGKSSLAQFIKELSQKDCNMLGVHTHLGGVTTVGELVRRLFDQLLKEAHTQTWFSKIKGFFGNYIEDIGLFGVSVKFAPPKDQLDGVVRDFPAALRNIYEALKDEKQGLLIILDDLNGLADQSDFANWYKSFVDQTATRGMHVPALFVLCGLPERRYNLVGLQPSLMRVFHIAEVERLSDEEVEHFFLEAFHNVGVQLSTQEGKTSGLTPLEIMVGSCSGMPTLMQEVGNAVYSTDDDGIVDDSDAFEGIRKAAEEVGRKYLDPIVYRAVRSARYRAILDKTAQSFAGEFDKQHLETLLNEDEKRVFDNFLRKMTQLGVIEADRDSGRGAYRFVNSLFHTYVRMQSNAPP
jgi:AAA ATPase domain